MKKLLILILILSTSILNSQYFTMQAYVLNEDSEQDYLQLEDYWSKIHAEAVKEGAKEGWSVWKVEPWPNSDFEMRSDAANYLIFSSYSTKEQMESSMNIDLYKSLAQKAFKGKMSKKNIDKKIFQGGNKLIKIRRRYQMKRVDTSIFAGGELKPGDQARVDLSTALNEDFEALESNVWKPIVTSEILKNNARYWSLSKVINRNENAYTDFDYMHFNLLVNDRKPYEISDDFKTNKLRELLSKSHKKNPPSALLTCVYTVN
tara:strand:+ start:1328 stop:2110 length:783 start_codon:yes stop_codon:yes gene_type:complete